MVNEDKNFCAAVLKFRTGRSRMRMWQGRKKAEKESRQKDHSESVRPDPKRGAACRIIFVFRHLNLALPNIHARKHVWKGEGDAATLLRNAKRMAPGLILGLDR